MKRPPWTRTIGRTAVVGGYVVALALVGRPVWAAVLLGLALVLVWAAPVLLAPPRRRPATDPAALPVVEPKEARPG